MNRSQETYEFKTFNQDCKEDFRLFLAHVKVVKLEKIYKVNAPRGKTFLVLEKCIPFCLFAFKWENLAHYFFLDECEGGCKYFKDLPSTLILHFSCIDICIKAKKRAIASLLFSTLVAYHILILLFLTGIQRKKT